MRCTGFIAGFAAAASVLAAPARSQELVVAIFGGSFADNAKICHVAPFEKATGAKVVFVFGSSPENIGRLRATKGRPEIDVAYMDRQIVIQAKAEGLLDELSTANVKNIKDLYPIAIDEDRRWVAFMFSGTAIAYNPQKVKTPPTSWADLWAPEYKGKIAISDVSYSAGMHFLIAASRLNGGSVENIDPGFEAIKRLRPGIVTFYTQADQVVTLIERGDIIVAPWYVDRVGAAAAKGIPVALAFPKEGTIGITPTASVPLGSKRKELAEKYIDVLLSPEGQKCYAERQYAGPTNKLVELPEAIAKMVPYKENIDTIFFPDAGYIAKTLPTWADRWAREIVR
ncbi:MAG: ABC transporter substrate-binding protein [Alphaproteobacteria bacterium]|nr:ABC transporter substrate-binding protein [Alphaproteobacteria bacterium]